MTCATCASETMHLLVVDLPGSRRVALCGAVERTSDGERLNFSVDPQYVECGPCEVHNYLLAEVEELRLALANSEPTVSARRDLERVNLRLVEANQKIAGLKARLDRKKAS